MSKPDIQVTITNRQGEWWYVRKVFSWVFSMKCRRVGEKTNRLIIKQQKLWQAMVDLEQQIREEEYNDKKLIEDVTDPSSEGKVYLIKADDWMQYFTFSMSKPTKLVPSSATGYRRFIKEFETSEGAPERPVRNTGKRTPSELNTMKGLGKMVDDDGRVIMTESPDRSTGEISFDEAINRSNPPRKGKGNNNNNQ